MYLKKIKHPEYFQGKHKRNHYFEGWYYKLVSRDLKTSIALIPGISINKKDPHAFIQIFISTEHQVMTHYVQFKSEEFTYRHDSFMVQIEKQIFSKEAVELDIKNNEISIEGKIELQEHTPIKNNLYAPNIMGPFAYIPFMECNHGVLSMQSLISGKLKVNDELIDFTNGKAYIEKDWGKSFPNAYIWLQSNHFTNNKTSVMFSYAIIPFLGFSFKGLIANLVYDNKEFRFSTYNLSRILKKEIHKKEISFILKKGKYKLHIYAKKDREIELKAPSFGVMDQMIKEGLSGEIKIKLYIKKALLYEDIGSHACIEIMM